MDEKDVNVSISEKILTIKGERKKEEAEKASIIIAVRDAAGLSNVHSSYRQVCKLIRLMLPLRKVS